MKRFRFRLEHVLRVRRLQEDMARAALMTAHHDARAAADVLNARVEDYTSAPRPSGAQTYDDFNRTQSHLDNAAGAIDAARAVYSRALDVVDARQHAWAAARQRVAALERLEARRRDEHAIELRRAEDRLVDDLVVARHARGTHR